MKTNRLESHDVWRYSVFVFSALHTFCSSRFFGKQVKKTSWCKFAFQHRWERKQRENWSNASITTCCFRSRVIYLVPTCTVELHRACLKPHLIPDWGLKQRFEKSLSSPPKNGRKRSAIDDLRKVIGRQYVVIKCNKLCKNTVYM